MNTQTSNTLQDFIDSLGLEYAATFQPKPQPRETVEHPQLHWLVTLRKGKQVIQVPYSEGMGHVEGYKQFHKTPFDKRMAEECYRKTCETGNLYRYNNHGEIWPSVLGHHVQPPPKLVNVLWCLVQDASVLNYSSYEEWCPELGYDIDSRKGEESYRQCLRQSLALKNILGHDTLEKLTELYQYY